MPNKQTKKPDLSSFPSKRDEKGEKRKGAQSLPCNRRLYLSHGRSWDREEVLLMILCPIWLPTRPNKQGAPSTKRSPLTPAVVVQKLTQFALWGWNAALRQVHYNREGRPAAPSVRVSAPFGLCSLPCRWSIYLNRIPAWTKSMIQLQGERA